MPHLSRAASDAVRRVRDVAADASSAVHLAQRTLAVLSGPVPFDEGALFLVDPDSLLLTDLLAYRGASVEGMYGWVRDFYLVAGEPPPMHFPTLLSTKGGVGAYHVEPDRWLGVAPVGLAGTALARAWRETETPAGGFLRYGIAYRRRWVAALQLARVEPGPGFRPSEVEVLDRTVPVLGRALGGLLAAEHRGTDPAVTPAGRLIFGADRRMISGTASTLQWLARLSAGDHLHPRPEVPVALQALVNHLAGSGVAAGRVATNDATVFGEVLVQLSGDTGEPSLGYCLNIEPGAPATRRSLTGAQWVVAQAVGRGLADKEIAAALGVATSTVHERVAALHGALGTHTRGELVAALAPLARPTDTARH
jgi:hypothetical protein